MAFIKTPNDDLNSTMQSGYIKFRLPDNAKVYVAYDSRATSLPNWMRGFTYTGKNIYTSLASQNYLKIYSKAYLKDDYVDLGGNYASGSSSEYRSNYIVFYDQPVDYSATNPAVRWVRFQETTMQVGRLLHRP